MSDTTRPPSIDRAPSFPPPLQPQLQSQPPQQPPPQSQPQSQPQPQSQQPPQQAYAPISSDLRPGSAAGSVAGSLNAKGPSTDPRPASSQSELAPPAGNGAQEAPNGAPSAAPSVASASGVSAAPAPAPAPAKDEYISKEPPTILEVGHEDMIHDIQIDFYGKRLASCSSDHLVKIFDVVEPNGSDVAAGGRPSAPATSSHMTLNPAAAGTGEVLRGHDGPVWAVAWAHPKFGTILASCSFDGRVFIWKEQVVRRGWERIKEHSLHTASVNAISWAPHEHGAVLACASSDGKVSVLTFNDDSSFSASMFSAHPLGVTSISWAPSAAMASITTANNTDKDSIAPKRFASGGCDGLVRIWVWSEQTSTFVQEDEISTHTDWVRDVAWAPSVGLDRSCIASCGQDKKVYIHTCSSSNPSWVSTPLDADFKDTVWRVSWSVSGTLLAVSCGDGQVSLWKESDTNKWEQVGDVSA